MRLIVSTLVAALALTQAGAPGAGGIGDVERLFEEPPADSRIMMRWWWFGPSQTREELDVEMRHMKEGGIGGFEVAAVYPLAVDDPASGFYITIRTSRPSFSTGSRSRHAARASSGCAWTSPSAAAGRTAARTSRRAWRPRGCAPSAARHRDQSTGGRRTIAGREHGDRAIRSAIPVAGR